MKRLKSVEAELARLRKLDDAELGAQYRRYYRKPPPGGIPRELLLPAIGFRLQQELIAQLRFRISQALSAAEAITDTLSIGHWHTVLVRVWRGQSHVVTLLDDRVLYQGREYRSLTTAARRITGGRLSAAELFGEEAVCRRGSGDSDGKT